MTIRTVNNVLLEKSSARLMEDVLNEFVQTNGIDVTYIPRASSGNVDPLFGDDPVKSYANNYTIECYIQSVDNFENSEIFSKFGLQVKKQAKFLMPNRAWKREVQGAYLRPREGDLLWLKNFNALFEIKYVNEEYFFYAFGQGATDPNSPETEFYAFSCTAEKFRYNNETIQTTVPEVTSIFNSIVSTYIFNLNPGGTGTYQLNEAVYQTANNSSHGTQTTKATVTAWNKSTATLQLNSIQGDFLTGVSIFGANSGAVWTLESYNMLQDVNNPLMDNPEINSAANTILNFIETNPFGDS